MSVGLHMDSIVGCNSCKVESHVQTTPSYILGKRSGDT